MYPRGVRGPRRTARLRLGGQESFGVGGRSRENTRVRIFIIKRELFCPGICLSPFLSHFTESICSTLVNSSTSPPFLAVGV